MFSKGRHFTIASDQKCLKLSRGVWNLVSCIAICAIISTFTMFTWCVVSRVCLCKMQPMPLRQLHEIVGHPEFAQLYHFVRQRNLPHSSEETKTVRQSYRTCAELKPRFKSPSQTPAKALYPAVLNWGCSHPQGVREGTSWGVNLSDDTKNNTSNGANKIFPSDRVRTSKWIENRCFIPLGTFYEAERCHCLLFSWLRSGM